MGAARTAAREVGPCTAVIVGALPTCRPSGVWFGLACACGGFTAATSHVPARPSLKAYRSWWRPSPGARAGWLRRRAGLAPRWAVRQVRGCCPGCPCRPAPTPCCACSTDCLCRRRPTLALSGLMTGQSVRDAATAQSSLTWSSVEWSICCLTVPQPRWLHGCGNGRGSRLSHATALRNMPAASRSARHRPFRLRIGGICWPTCVRPSSAGLPVHMAGFGGFRPSPTRAGESHIRKTTCQGCGRGFSGVSPGSGDTLHGSGSGDLCRH
jgi:hypothetical protein